VTHAPHRPQSVVFVGDHFFFNRSDGEFVDEMVIPSWTTDGQQITVVEALYVWVSANVSLAHGALFRRRVQ